jgi:hypothetical protein
VASDRFHPNTPQTESYGEAFLALARPKFPEHQALWLLLSLHHYGWRAHLDVAHRLIAGVSEVPTDDLARHHWQHRMMAAMEEMFLLVDQLWRVALSARAHRVGKSFLNVYCQRRDPKEAFEELARLTEEDWARLLSVPTVDQLDEFVADHDVDETFRGVYLQFRDELPAECVGLMADVKTKFFDKWTKQEENYSLREANNAHRHGTRLLYPDTAPQELAWNTKISEQQKEHFDGNDPTADTIDVLMRAPGSDGMAYMVKLPYSIEAAEMLLASMRRLSQLMDQIVRALLLSQAFGEPAPTALIATAWAPLSP